MTNPLLLQHVVWPVAGKAWHWQPLVLKVQLAVQASVPSLLYPRLSQLAPPRFVPSHCSPASIMPLPHASVVVVVLLVVVMLVVVAHVFMVLVVVGGAAHGPA